MHPEIPSQLELHSKTCFKIWGYKLLKVVNSWANTEASGERWFLSNLTWDQQGRTKLLPPKVVRTWISLHTCTPHTTIHINNILSKHWEKWLIFQNREMAHKLKGTCISFRRQSSVPRTHIRWCTTVTRGNPMQLTLLAGLCGQKPCHTHTFSFVFPIIFEKCFNYTGC